MHYVIDRCTHFNGQNQYNDTGYFCQSFSGKETRTLQDFVYLVQVIVNIRNDSISEKNKYV